MTVLVILPIAVPLATAAIALLAWRRRGLQQALAVLGALALVGAGAALLVAVDTHGIQSTQVGGWPAPFGITLVADLFSAIMVVVAAVIGLAGIVYSLGSVDHRREAFGYYALMHLLLLGVCAAFLAGDLFNLYVWFEVMLVTSFALLALGGQRLQLEGAVKYVTLNLVGSAIFLSAVGLLYGTAGTLNLADLSRKLPAAAGPGLTTTIAVLFLVAFGLKAGVFPFFFWLPASYPTPPIAVAAVFAGLLTKVGVYALIRVFTLLFTQDPGYTHGLILAIAGLSMVTGVLGAVAQDELRRILSFHIVSQIGYMVMGLGLHTPLGIAAAIYYIVHHILVKTNLFLLSGVAAQLGGSFRLGRLGGLATISPTTGALFLVAALSLAGVPPLSGFVAKLALVRAGLDVGQHAIVATAVAVSVLTLLSMTKIWNQAFWSRAPEAGAVGSPELGPGRRALLLAPVLSLATLTVLLGLGAQPAFELAQRAAAQLAHPSAYVETVLRPR